MARKGENIYKRKDGRYEGRYIKGRKENGKPHYGSVYSRSYKDVREKLTILKAEYLKNNHDFETQNVNKTGKPDGNAIEDVIHLSDWFDFWLETVKPGLKPSTYSYYLGTVERHLKPFLGDIPIRRLSSGNLRQFITFLSEKGLSPSYIHDLFKILNSSLEKAVKTHAIYVNPCVDVSLPKREPARLTPLTLMEQNALERSAMTDKIGPAVMLSLYTGMRVGEICALTWEDVDFNKNIINVRRTLQRIQDNSGAGGRKTKIISGPPKSGRSERIIPIPPNVVKYLCMIKEESTGDYVMSCKGSYTEPRNMNYRFQKLLNKANMPPMHFHVLRHTFATRCMEMGISITAISKILGHSSVKMTLDVYTDATMEDKIAAVTTLENMLTLAFQSKDSLTVVQ